MCEFASNEKKILVQPPGNPISLDFFKFNINDDIIDKKVTETNIYAEQYREKTQEFEVTFSGSSLETR